MAVIKEGVGPFSDPNCFFLNGEVEFKLKGFGECLYTIRVGRVDRNIPAAAAAKDCAGQRIACCGNFPVDGCRQGEVKVAGQSQFNAPGPFSYQGDVPLADNHDGGGFGCADDIAEECPLLDKTAREVVDVRQDEESLFRAAYGELMSAFLGAVQFGSGRVYFFLEEFPSDTGLKRYGMVSGQRFLVVGRKYPDFGFQKGVCAAEQGVSLLDHGFVLDKDFSQETVGSGPNLRILRE